MNRFRTPRSLYVSAFLVLLAFGFAGSAAHAQTALAALRPVAQANRVGAHPDFAPQKQLTGHLPGWVNSGNQVSAQSVDVTAPLHVSVLLRRDPAVQTAFEKLLADQQTPGSPLYHQWLTPQQVGSLFGPTASDVATVSSWLAAQGLKVESIAPSQVILEVSGSTAAVGNAFRTSFGYFSLGGTPRLSAIAEPSIPSALASVVASIHGLTDIPLNPLSFRSEPHASPMASAANPSPLLTTTNGSHYLTPNDFATIYDINSVYNGGNIGGTIGSKAGHVAIIGRSRVAATDISEFATNVGIASYNLNTIIPTTGVDPGAVCTFANAATCTTAGDQGEQTLDVDRVIGTAPGVQADLVVATSASGGIYLAASYNVNTLLDPVMTISYGACETNAGSANVNIWDTLYATGAAEGISTFVASGDSGANACAPAFTPTSTTRTASINYICSSSYDTCVGGTEFNDTANPSTYWATGNSTGLESALSYIPEGAWNEPSSTSGTTTTYTPTATGGGTSVYISKPTWQTGTGVPADGQRDTPDVSFPAAGHDGFYACLDYALGNYVSQGITSADNCTSTGGGYFFVFSGTSAAAPSMAGVAALLDSKLGTAQGNMNPLFYKLAATAGVFHDATVASSGVSGCVITTPSMCNNSTPGSSANSTTAAGGVQGFGLATGYDEATGLGSLDVANLLNAAVSLTPSTLALTTVSPNPASTTQTVTLTATLTPASSTPGAATGTVTFYSTAAGGTATQIGNAITIASNVATTTTTFSTAGTYGITAIYSGDSNYSTSAATSVSLVITPGPTFTVVPTTTTYALTSGATTGNTDAIIVTSSNGFAGTATLTCAVANASGTAAGTCSLSSTSAVLTSGSSATSTLTIATTVGTSGALNVTVTGTSGSTVVTSSTINVTLVGAAFTLSQPGALSFTSGATTGNTTATTLTSTNGFAGPVTLACSVSASAAAFQPTCAMTPTPVTLTSGGTSAETIAIGSTVAQGKTGGPQQAALGGWSLPVGVLLAGLLCAVGLRRRRSFGALAAMALLTLGLSALAGCGGSSTPATPATPAKKSSAGSYTVTVTATGTTAGALIPAPTATTSFSLTIN